MFPDGARGRERHSPWIPAASSTTSPQAWIFARQYAVEDAIVFRPCGAASRHSGNCDGQLRPSYSACSCWPPSSHRWRTWPRTARATPTARTLATFDESSHEAAHRDGQPHAHAASSRAPKSGSHAERSSATRPYVGRTSTLTPTTTPKTPAGRSSGVPDRDHGRESISHFGLALNEGPPPPIVPAPAGTIASPPDARPRAQRSTPRPQPPTRGPPDLTRRPHSLS